MGQAAIDAVVGWCDGYDRGHVRGWAWFPRRPHETVTVQLVVDGSVVAEAAACVSRPDLKTAGIGHGRHAFAIPFALPPDVPQALFVTVRAKNGPVLNDGEFAIQSTPDEHRLRNLRSSKAYLEAVFGSFESDVPTIGKPSHRAAQPIVNFILYCATGTGDIASKLGTADYSYSFVMRGFREVLRRMGTVHVVADPAREVDVIYTACRGRDEECFFLSFAPPHDTSLGLSCPTIPVIAWEFGTIPTQVWDDEPRHDWRYVLRQCGRAITISGFAADVIARTMGGNFPVASIPTPVWDRLATMRARIAPEPPPDRAPVAVDGFIWDSRSAHFFLGMNLPPIPAGTARPAPGASLRDWRWSLAEEAAAEAQIQASPQAAAPEEQADAPASRPVELAPDDGATTQPDHDGREAATIGPEPLHHSAQSIPQLTLRWYREVARDALPLPVTRGVSLAGRAARRVRRALRAAPSAVAPTAQDNTAASEGVGAAVPEITDPSPRQTAAPLPAPTRPAIPHPLPDEPPLPEPVLAVFSPDPYSDAEPPKPSPQAVLALDGIVFTSVLAPKDGRKNWQDILSAFAIAFADTPDATLVFKMIGADAAFWWWEFHDIITRLPQFSCRVIVLQGYLTDDMYQQLIGNTHFVVNASLAEGQCLPLVEFMSGGRPAIAPAHTAMLDYITAANAFIVGGDVEYCAWPHNPGNDLVATRYRVDWASLHDAFTQAYAVATSDADRYRAMGVQASATMQRYCGDAAISAALQDILCLRASAAPPTGEMAA